MANWMSPATAPWLTAYSTKITAVVIEDGVTNIGARAFSHCIALESVSIGKDVTVIGSSAFAYCEGLKSINVSTDNTDYKSIDGDLYTKDGTRLVNYAIGKDDSSFTVPDHVTTLDNQAFFYSRNLERIELGSTINSIGKSSFRECIKLLEIVVSDSNTTYKTVNGNLYTKDGTILIKYAEGKIDAEFIIPESVTTIFEYAFFHANNLQSVTLPENITEIKSEAFAGCKKLMNIIIPSIVSVIDRQAFYNCTNLTIYCEATSQPEGWDANWNSSNCPVIWGYNADPYGEAIEKWNISATSSDSVTAKLYADKENEGYYKLVISGTGNMENWISSGSVPWLTTISNYSAKITSVIIEDGVTNIGSYAFYSCKSLSNITIPESVSSIGSYAFYNCTALTNITLLDNFVSIGDQAFRGCESIEHIVIPSTIQTVGNYVFAYCSGLKSVVVRNKTIGYGMFYECSALSDVTIESGVASIGRSAFYNCSSLAYKKVIIPKTVTAVDQYIFEGCGKVKLYCEAESQPAGWHEWWNYYNNCTVTWGYYEKNISTNLTLGSDLSVNAYVNFKETDGVKAVARFTMNESVREVAGVYVPSLGLWKFTFTGVTPINIGDSIKIEMIVNGETVASLEDYSVKNYCTNLLGMTKDELGLSDAKYAAIRTLVCDLLDYGAAAQKYMNYKTDELVNEGIEGASEFVPVTSTDMNLTNLTSVDGVKLKSANLRFNNANQLRFNFTAPDPSLVQIRVMAAGKLWYYTADDFVYENNVYSIYTDSVYATEFDVIYYATIIYDGVEVQTAAYSVRSYTYSKQNSTDAALSELIQATYKYGKSAKAYADAK